MIHFHEYKYIRTERTKHACFGFSGCELPGIRYIEKCCKCGKIKYTSLNLMMSEKYLYQEHLWKKEINEKRT